MNIADIQDHGTRQQIRRVLLAMTPEQIDKGLSAFVNGSSSWSHCFFARAFAPALNLNWEPEQQLMEVLKLPTVVPIRIVYFTFDGAGVTMNREQLADFIKSCREDTNRDEVMNFIKSLGSFEGVENKAIQPDLAPSCQ